MSLPPACAKLTFLNRLGCFARNFSGSFSADFRLFFLSGIFLSGGFFALIH